MAAKKTKTTKAKAPAKKKVDVVSTKVQYAVGGRDLAMSTMDMLGTTTYDSVEELQDRAEDDGVLGHGWDGDEDYVYEITVTRVAKLKQQKLAVENLRYDFELESDEEAVE